MKTRNIYEDAALIQKAFLDELDEADHPEMKKLLEEKPELKEVYEHLNERGEVKKLLNQYHNYPAEKAYQNFLDRIHPPKEQSKHTRILRWWYSAAAIVVLAVGVSFWLTNSPSGESSVTAQVPVIVPGDTKGELVLPDGQVIDVHKKDINVNINGVKVTYKKGILTYEKTPDANRQIDENAVADYNRLVIPKGGENTVILSDGSKVHLNAGSKLIYPVRFIGKERRVSLEGEAYFDVAKDEQHPFIVETRFGNVNVVGTAFNVNAYNDEKACYTTLVQGKVIFETADHQQITLLPGEQAIASAAGIDKREVDLDEYVGWVNGIYVFKDKKLGELMKAFSKWYDIAVLYQTPALKNLTYSGNLKRYDTINAFLDALTLTGDLTYKINGKNVLIYEIEKD